MRPTHVTRFAEGIPVPDWDDPICAAAEIASGRYVLLGGFSPEAITEIAIWERLLDSSDTSCQIFRRLFLVDPKVGQDVMSAIPRSKQSSWAVVADQGWKELVQPDIPSRAFASIIAEARIDLIMIGPPTEDAWESFEDRLRSSFRDEDR